MKSTASISPGRSRGRSAVRRRELACLVAALLLAAALRGAYWLELRGLPEGPAAAGPDVEAYHEWALDILGGRALWVRVHEHAPLYPYFLALAYRLARGHLGWVRLLQLLLNLAAMLALWAALQQAGRRRLAALAAFLWALYLPGVYYSAALVSESLLPLWLCLGCFFLLHGLRRARLGRGRRTFLEWFAAGLFLGLGGITHPLFLAPALLVPVWLGFRVHWDRRRVLSERPALRPLLAAGLAGIGLSLGPAGVTLRNYLVSGRLVLVQARAGLNFYIGNHAGATGTPTAPPGPAYRRLVEADARGRLLPRALGFIRRHPAAWLRLLLRKLLLTWNATEIPSGVDVPQARRRAPLMRVPFLNFALAGPLALLGLGFRRSRRGLGPFLAVLAGGSGALTLFVTSGRYRVGMLPAVLALAAAGLDLLVLRFRAVRRGGRVRPVLVPLGVLAVAAGLVNLPRAPAMPAAESEAEVDAATAAYRAGRFASARRLALQAIRSGRNAGQAWHLLGILAADRGRLREAIRCYREALRVMPDAPLVRVNLAIALSDAGDKRGARRLLLAVLRRYPRCAEAWYNLGVEEEAAGKPGRAEAAYRQALWARPGLASAHLNLAVLLARAGRKRAARRHLAAALRIEPSKVRAMNVLAVVYAEQGERKRAAYWFARSLAIDPQQPRVRQAYADLVGAGRETAAESAGSAGPAGGRLAR